MMTTPRIILTILRAYKLLFGRPIPPDDRRDKERRLEGKVRSVVGEHP
jgi:hypothetical protein